MDAAHRNVINVLYFVYYAMYVVLYINIKLYIYNANDLLGKKKFILFATTKKF